MSVMFWLLYTKLSYSQLLHFGAHTHQHTSTHALVAVGQKFIIARRIILINYAGAKYALLSKVCHEFCAIFWLQRVFCSCFIGDKDHRGYWILDTAFHRWHFFN